MAFYQEFLMGITQKQITDSKLLQNLDVSQLQC